MKKAIERKLKLSPLEKTAQVADFNSTVGRNEPIKSVFLRLELSSKLKNREKMK